VLRVLAMVILSMSAFAASAADESRISGAALAQIQGAYKVRTEAQAAKAAVESLNREVAPAYSPVGVVLELTKAHRKVGAIDRGDLVWFVEVINRGASDLVPVPEGLMWVRARDGIVVQL
jgi:hypothetical protein